MYSIGIIVACSGSANLGAGSFTYYATNVSHSQDPTPPLGVVHILRNQQRREGVSKCLRLITGGGGGGGGLAVDYVIKILILPLYQFEFFYLIHFPNEFLEPVF